MIKIGICDDNRIERVGLKQKIMLYLSKRDIRHEIFDYENAQEFLRLDTYFDIIFLDIDMPGINGIELGKRIREQNKNVKIIYITGYAEYVYAAFNVHAFFYLVKPVKQAVFQATLRDVLSYLHDKTGAKLALKTTIGTLMIEPAKIYYFEFMNRKINIVTAEGNYMMTGGLADLGEKMRDYGFALSHKAFLVNLYHIRRIAAYQIHLINGAIIPLAEKKSPGFKTLYNDFLQKIVDQS